ncbi:hypothetical protein B0181_06770 [Moraxella caviae]|uniref:Uncharacterized protein n=1 Tax=Moraxella caviae TaxID=34060 RepID=A0A1T0A0S7_9GAMM|nr:hypothetical protein B0181_06770 [Moraxella caviae]
MIFLVVLMVNTDTKLPILLKFHKNFTDYLSAQGANFFRWFLGGFRTDFRQFDKQLFWQFLLTAQS